MRNHPDTIISLADDFQRAALAGGQWTQAIDRLASVTRSSRAQLIGFTTKGVMFNWVTGMDEVSLQALEAINGHDPRINSRVRVGSRAPELTVLTERNFSTADDMANDPAYGEWIEDHGPRYLCLSPLWRDRARLVGLSIARTPNEGDIDHDALDIFARIAPHVRSAVRTMMALGDRSATILTENLGQVDVAAIICEADGRIVALSNPAEALLEEREWLTSRHHRLWARNGHDDGRLISTIHHVATNPNALPQKMTLPAHSDGHLILIEISRVPGDSWMQPGRVLLIAYTHRRTVQRAAADAQLLFDLTNAERQIVEHLIAGQSATAIAGIRGVALGTVRTQIRHILEKADVTSQAVLMARLITYP